MEGRPRSRVQGTNTGVAAIVPAIRASPVGWVEPDSGASGTESPGRRFDQRGHIQGAQPVSRAGWWANTQSRPRLAV